ncbi:thioesterase superfamily protein [Desulfatibacillum aliphaticivorans]|uniref:Thioesterase superfamily protein n=1 Tax=Desulfatibacillum aliphaticivorans TaxID=218208 RepID=B8FBI9_DESAL|nr:PaaI family thioesterase [Desulfatibacillum aliphaticivorans]ACL04742.1 thioesterase superfamily protein [Desulfatibacillum aliphaticivorans]
MTDWKRVLDSLLEDSPDEPLITSRAHDTLGLPKLKKWSEGMVYAEWTFDERMGNSRGEVYGGFYAALGDTLSALAAMTVLKPDEIVKTTDLRVSYFRPMKEGVVHATAVVINRSRTTVHVEVDFKNSAGKLLAKAYATHQAVKPVQV